LIFICRDRCPLGDRIKSSDADGPSAVPTTPSRTDRAAVGYEQSGVSRMEILKTPAGTRCLATAPEPVSVSSPLSSTNGRCWLKADTQGGRRLCPVMAKSRHSGHKASMSAYGPKPDVRDESPECLEMTQSGHGPSSRIPLSRVPVSSIYSALATDGSCKN
jgi:hypothetical protein